jgi:hypothetical protein
MAIASKYICFVNNFILLLFDLFTSSPRRYENMDIALHYGAMLRECIRHQSIAR